MSLYFITGNRNKFEEMKMVIPSLEQMDIDLAEIQELDAQKVIEAKLIEAKKYHKGEFIVEDTSLYADSLNGLPGTLVKWFIKAIGLKEIVKMVANTKNTDASVRTIIGHINTSGVVSFFESEMKGSIVYPKGENGFGWDPIFRPVGEKKTFAEMNPDEKAKFNTRKMAATKLIEKLTNEVVSIIN